MIANRERFFPNEEGEERLQTGGEAVGGVDFQIFRFDSTEFNARFMVFPSLTTGGAAIKSAAVCPGKSTFKTENPGSRTSGNAYVLVDFPRFQP